MDCYFLQMTVSYTNGRFAYWFADFQNDGETAKLNLILSLFVQFNWQMIFKHFTVCFTQSEAFTFPTKPNPRCMRPSMSRLEHIRNTGCFLLLYLFATKHRSDTWQVWLASQCARDLLWRISLHRIVCSVILSSLFVRFGPIWMSKRSPVWTVRHA